MSLPSDQSSLGLCCCGQTDTAVSLGRPEVEQVLETDFSSSPPPRAKQAELAKLRNRISAFAEVSPQTWGRGLKEVGYTVQGGF